jgi:adenylate cyclase class 2
MNNILESVGFCREQVYEKWRETFIFNNLVLCLDTMPFGDFLEIEGDGQEIEAVAERIGLLWENRIRSNYFALFEKLRADLNLSFSDITFENFKSVVFHPDHFFSSKA